MNVKQSWERHNVEVKDNSINIKINRFVATLSVKP